jgi:hypothetical protein
MMVVLISVLTTLLVSALGGLIFLAYREWRNLQERVEDLEDEAQKAQERVLQLERMAREQLAVDLVLGNLLVEKGVCDEDEIEDAHRRLVIEPAMIDEEHETLLADLPDQERVRGRMLRNVPGTMQ